MKRRDLFRGLAALALAMNLPIRAPTTTGAGYVGTWESVRFIHTPDLAESQRILNAAVRAQMHSIAVTGGFVHWSQYDDPETCGPGKGDVIKMRLWKSEVLPA